MVVYGDERNFVVALVTLDPDAIEDWAERQRAGRHAYAEIVNSEAASRWCRATSTS